MRIFGLVGKNLSHSFSEKYFSEKFKKLKINNARYVLFPMDDVSTFRDLCNENHNLFGLNVTIPYKTSIMHFLDEINTEAAVIGAVNTIKISRNNNAVHLKGFNTDAFGFIESFKNNKKNTHKKALVLGTGGAAKAVSFALNLLNIESIMVSRTPKDNQEMSYEMLSHEVIRSHTLIINTTPVGMFPNNDVCPDIPYEAIGKQHFVYDLIYNPQKTLFLEKAEKQNAVILNGMGMLYEQAEKSWRIWNE